MPAELTEEQTAVLQRIDEDEQPPASGPTVSRPRRQGTAERATSWSTIPNQP